MADNTMISFDSSNINIEELAEQVFIGPQGQILEKIERLNSIYNFDIGVNKSFGFKPGVYDQLKEALITRWLRFNQKNAGIHALFKRIDTNSYTKQSLKREFCNLENDMKEMRSSGVKWQDNTDECVLAIEYMKEALSPNNFTSNFDGIKIDSINLILEDNPKHHFIEIGLTIDEGTMDVYREDSSIVQTIPTDSISMRIRLSLIKMLNVYSNPNNRKGENIVANQGYYGYRARISDGFSVFNAGIIIYSKYNSKLNHPYVSYDNDDNFTGQCFGDLSSTIFNNAWSLQIPSLLYNLKMWSSRYTINVTHPLNALSRMYYGQPSYLEKEYLSIIGARNANECQLTSAYDYNEVITPEDVDICNSIDCKLKKDCNYYKMMTYGSILSPEEEGMWGDLYINIIDIELLNDSIWNNAVQAQRHIRTDYSNAFHNLNDTYWTKCIDIVISNDVYGSKQQAYFEHIRWSDMEHLEDIVEGDCGSELPWIASSPDESHILERIARLGNNIPINIQQDTEPEERIVEEVPFNQNPF